MRPTLPRFPSLAFAASLILALMWSVTSPGAPPPSLSSRTAANADDRADVPEPSRIAPSADLTGFLAECDRLVSDDHLLAARRRLALALGTSELTLEQQGELRARLAAIHQVTFFSPRIVPGDPFTDRHVVKPGDTLARIAERLDLGVDWRLLQRVNHLPHGGRVQAFQAIKIVHGPFHARLSRHDFRLDLYIGEPAHPERWLFVRSFAVGLGEKERTPVGDFVVRNGGKVTDPFWTDPQTGTWYAPGAADNPIGDRWIGLEGLGESASLTGFGLHGTVDPESIGEARSMGCIRLLPDDVHLVFELLTEGVSRVLIEP